MGKARKQEKIYKRHYRKKKVRKGWIVINCRTGAHTHVRSEYGAACLLLFLRENVKVTNEYLQESMRRLSDGAEPKQKYINKR